MVQANELDRSDQSYFCVGVQIPALGELPLSACGCKKITLDVLGDHVSTCTVHSGTKKAHDWSVEQLADLFRRTHRVKTQQVTRNRGQRCGEIELDTYLVNAWISSSPTNTSEVALTLVLMVIYITRMT